MQKRLLSFVQHPWFLNLTIGVILLNAVTLGLETSGSVQQLHKEEEAREMVESLKVRSELEALRNEVAALSALLRKP